MRKELQIYDTTLRDGIQGAGVGNLSVDGRKRIAERLGKIGLKKIEGGWPNSKRPIDTEFFRQMEHSGIPLVAFGMTRKMNTKVEEDPQVEDLLNARTKNIAVVGKSSKEQVEQVLETTEEENLAAVYETIVYLRENGAEIYFDAEHFFDGFKSNPGYALKVLKTAKNAGADTLVLCDTNGKSTYDFVRETVTQVKNILGPDTKLGIHAHNDRRYALPNSIEAVKAGVTQVQVTVNGLGERTGNTDLCSFVPDIEFDYGYSTGIKLEKLTPLSNFVSKVTASRKPNNLPWVGKDAFAHKGGLHLNGVGKNTSLYEHADPSIVGNKRVIIHSEQGGSSDIRKVAKLHSFDLSAENVESIASKMMEVGEMGDAQLFLEIYRLCGGQDPFEILRWRSVSSHDSKTNQPTKEATLKLKINDDIQHMAGNGKSVFNALDNALRKALLPYFLEVNDINLTEYDAFVPIDSERFGTDAKTIVKVKYASNGDEWSCVTAGDDEIDANFQNLVDSFMYWIVLQQRKPQKVIYQGPQLIAQF